jgi:hypothetical protein
MNEGYNKPKPQSVHMHRYAVCRQYGWDVASIDFFTHISSLWSSSESFAVKSKK